MPELPDVEMLKRVLDEHGLGKTIGRVVVHDKRILGKLAAATLARRLKGARLVSSLRHGKNLLAEMDKGGWITFHFGMTGGLRFMADGADEPPFTRLRLDFAGGGHLAYINRRMIGHVGFTESARKFIADAKLGPDALDPRFDFDTLAAAAAAKRDVKAVLMDQEVVAGIGNIYADEILFQARLSPKARTDELSSTQLRNLFKKIKQVLETAVKRKAGSEQWTDRLPKGWLLPARAAGGACPRCGTPLATVKIGGRTTYYCPRCQT
ncbi:MAG TPA: DNA-formamidopyrimidine glycosylase [Alphaproteobacteria bacterium]|nr:DNA-formamidopyrimidine glycosylase [Alphaproteobacteria bacterium]